MGAQEGRQLTAWAAMLGWPLIGDVLSQTGQPLPCADLWLAHPRAQETLAQAQMVLQFGSSLTSKRLYNGRPHVSHRNTGWWIAPQAALILLTIVADVLFARWASG